MTKYLLILSFLLINSCSFFEDEQAKIAPLLGHWEWVQSSGTWYHATPEDGYTMSLEVFGNYTANWFKADTLHSRYEIKDLDNPNIDAELVLLSTRFENSCGGYVPVYYEQYLNIGEQVLVLFVPNCTDLPSIYFTRKVD